MHAKGSRLVGSGRDNAALSRASSHDDGFAAPLRVVELLNAGKERIESIRPIAGPFQSPKRPAVKVAASKPLSQSYVCSISMTQV